MGGARAGRGGGGNARVDALEPRPPPRREVPRDAHPQRHRVGRAAAACGAAAAGMVGGLGARALRSHLARPDRGVPATMRRSTPVTITSATSPDAVLAAIKRDVGRTRPTTVPEDMRSRFPHITCRIRQNRFSL